MVSLGEVLLGKGEPIRRRWLGSNSGVGLYQVGPGPVNCSRLSRTNNSGCFLTYSSTSRLGGGEAKARVCLGCGNYVVLAMRTELPWELGLRGGGYHCVVRGRCRATLQEDRCPCSERHCAASSGYVENLCFRVWEGCTRVQDGSPVTALSSLMRHSRQNPTCSVAIYVAVLL